MVHHSHQTKHVNARIWMSLNSLLAPFAKNIHIEGQYSMSDIAKKLYSNRFEIVEDNLQP